MKCVRPLGMVRPIASVLVPVLAPVLGEPAAEGGGKRGALFRPLGLRWRSWKMRAATAAAPSPMRGALTIDLTLALTVTGEAARFEPGKERGKNRKSQNKASMRPVKPVWLARQERAQILPQAWDGLLAAAATRLAATRGDVTPTRERPSARVASRVERRWVCLREHWRDLRAAGLAASAAPARAKAISPLRTPAPRLFSPSIEAACPMSMSHTLTIQRLAARGTVERRVIAMINSVTRAQSAPAGASARLFVTHAVQHQAAKAQPSPERLSAPAVPRGFPHSTSPVLVWRQQEGAAGASGDGRLLSAQGFGPVNAPMFLEHQTSAPIQRPEPAPMPDMNGVVDEVMLRLDRRLSSERLRRGI